MASEINGIPCEIDDGLIKSSVQRVSDYILNNFPDDWVRIRESIDRFVYYSRERFSLVDLGMEANHNLCIFLKKYDYLESPAICTAYVAYRLATSAVTQQDLKLRSVCDNKAYALSLSASAYICKWGFDKEYGELYDFNNMTSSDGWKMYRPGDTMTIPFGEMVASEVFVRKTFLIAERFIPQLQSVSLECYDAEIESAEDGRVNIKLNRTDATEQQLVQ